MRVFISLIVVACLLARVPSAQATDQAQPNSSETARPTADHTWWKHAVIYEIYPRSFADTNGDGVGDLNGITKHLGYLQKLGIDAIWITPFYPSPQVDFGYDITDYETIDPQYGTLKDFDRLLSSAKKHDIRIILDMVLNHTSNKHPWFVESASSRNNPKADWYVWNSGIPAGSPGVTDYQRKNEHDGMVPPNNWVSELGGPAWEWVPARKQFYYHAFYKQQPDLNWRNPAVEEAMFSAVKFWLDRGVAGFRLDAIPEIFEDAQLHNETETGGLNDQGDPNLTGDHQFNQPETHDVLRRLRAMVDKYPGDRVLIGETYVHSTAALDQWYGGAAHDELQLPMDTEVGFGSFNAPRIRQLIDEAETQLHGSQPLFVFDNHDNVRSMDRLGDGVHNLEIAKAVATILLTSRATALTYYGAPIGMTTTIPQRKEDVRDPEGVSGWPKDKGRDGERTPMQWTPGPQAGFSSNPHTWLPVAPNYKTINVESESADPNSLLNWYKNLIELRRSNPALRDGGMVMLNTDNKEVLSYMRTAPEGKSPVIVAINMSSQPQMITLDVKQFGIASAKTHTLATSAPSLQGVPPLESVIPPLVSVTLPPFASWVAALQ
jgi:alpha-glucosidase